MERVLQLSELRNLISGKSPEESLKTLVSEYPCGVIFTTSFGMEDQVLTYMILMNDLPVEIVTLDTGRLFPETYKVFNDTFKKYKKRINILFPDNEAVEKMVSEKGPFSFYESLDNRLECCRLRKVVPLSRALKGKECWISGIRADQSDNRRQMNMLEYDDEKSIYKYHPLFNWSSEEVRQYIKRNNIPYNSLHDKGYESIGCEPCTRAIIPGQDFRAGRWWWETAGPKECGCHLK